MHSANVIIRNKDEFTEEKDLVNGLNVLTHTLLKLDNLFE